MTQQCSFCGNIHLSPARTRYFHQQAGDLLIVDDVPCIQCDYCGEQYFEAGALKKIEADHVALLTRRKQPKRVMQVSVEDFMSL